MKDKIGILFPFLRTIFKNRNTEKILDIGCGENVHEDATHAADWNIHDIDQYFIQCDLKQLFLPFKDEVFSLVYFCHVIEHFGRSTGLDILKEINRVLLPGGKLHIETANIYAVIKWLVDQGHRDIEDESMPAWNSPAWVLWTKEIYKGASHRYGYTDVTMERILNEAGFEVDIHNEYDTFAIIIIARKLKEVL